MSNPEIPELDDDGYPTEETLKIIREWQYDEVQRYADLMAFVGKAWHWQDYMYVNATKNSFGDRVWEYTCITGGWSGNEELVGALKDNVIFWTMCWRESHRGGKHIFEVRR